VTRTGPQYYPGANTTAAWYEDTYPGDAMEVNCIVLHTTEGRTRPTYDGGAVAPNLTALPDFTNKRLVWYQHFRLESSSRALVNLAGGVETNTNNVCQVELVGTCAKSTSDEWGSSAHIFWDNPPDWALRDLAAFLKWMNANHGVPLVGPPQSAWRPYPSSYGDTSTRFTNAEWNAFKGICGHEHVAENLHGDPGALPFARLIALAKGEDEDVALSADDISKVADAVVAKLIAGGGVLENGDIDRIWQRDNVPAPATNSDPDNKTWQAQSLLRGAYDNANLGKQAVASLSTKVDALRVSVAEVQTLLAGLDLTNLPGEVAAKLAKFKVTLEETS
jgi:hypothetical protein